MRITELFTAQSIALDEAQQDRSQIIDRLVELQATHGNIRDKEAYKKGLYEREDEGSTYVDNGITVPHAKCDCVTRPSLAALRLKTPGAVQCRGRRQDRPAVCHRSPQERQSPCGYAGPYDADAHERGLRGEAAHRQDPGRLPRRHRRAGRSPVRRRELHRPGDRAGGLPCAGRHCLCQRHRPHLHGR